MFAQALDAAVDEIAGDGDDVGLEGVDLADDALEKVAADRRPDVHVRELHDARAGERARQPSQPDAHAIDLHRAERAGEPGGPPGEPERARRRGEQAGEGDAALGLVGAGADPQERQQRPHEIAPEGAHEQQEREAQPAISGEGERAHKLAGQRGDDEREGDGQRDGAQGQQGRRSAAVGGRQVRVANEARP